MIVDQAAELLTLINRSSVGSDAPAYDALVNANIERMKNRLRFRGAGEPLRAGRFEEAAAAAFAVSSSSQLANVLDPNLLDPIAGDACGTMAAVDATTMSLRLAAHLLTNETAPARYVTVVDGGVIPSQDAGGYDTHNANCPSQARNVSKVLQSLADVINAPGEDDPAKIDLDSTLVIINTEFGRTPHGEGMGGRGHWPNAYPVAVIGGPVDSASAGVYGATDENEEPLLAISPAEHRIAVLLSLGIWPFEQEGYNVSDVFGTATEPEAATVVREKVFGA